MPGARPGMTNSEETWHPANYGSPFRQMRARRLIVGARFPRKRRLVGPELWRARLFSPAQVPFTVWTLTPGVRLAILSFDSRVVGKMPRATSRYCRAFLGAKNVGRIRIDASDAAVVLIAGAQRPDWTRRYVAACLARLGRRRRLPRHALDSARLQPPGSRGADHCAGIARFFRAGGDPLDAHPHPRRQERIPAACRHRGLAAA